MKKLLALFSRETERPIRRGQPVVLQMEVCTRTQAVLLQAALWSLIVGMTGVAVVILLVRNRLFGVFTAEGGNTAYFEVILATAAFCTFLLLSVSLVFAWRLSRELKRDLIWSRHQVALVVEAVGHLITQVLMTTTWLVPYCLIVARPCDFPAAVVSVFAQLRWSCLSLLILWLSIMTHSMTCHSHGNRLHRYIERLMAYLLPRVFDTSSNADEGITDKIQHGNVHTDGSNGSVNGSMHAPPSLSKHQQTHAALHDNIKKHDMQPDSSSSLHQNGNWECEYQLTINSATPPADAGAVKKVRFKAPEGQEAQHHGRTGTEGQKEGCHVELGGGGAEEVQPSCTDSAEPPRQLVVDLPIRKQILIHIPKMLLWMGLEGGVMFGFVQTWSTRGIGDVLDKGCNGAPCRPSTREIVAMAMETAILFIYLAVFFFYQRRAFRDHRGVPYHQYRITSMAIRVQARSISVVLFATFIDHIILIVAGITSCWTYMQVYVGLPPVQVCLAVVALISAYLYLPASQTGAPSLETFFHEFSWTQASFEEAKKLRDQNLLDYLGTQPTGKESVLQRFRGKVVTVDYSGAAAIEQLKNEPMFCMELAVRFFYWSRLAYLHGEENARIKEDVALKLFNLQNFEILYEEETHVKVLLGWGGSGEIIVSFRGTVTTKNVITDLKFLRTWHGKDKRWSGSLPVMVHAGFAEAWTKNGFDQRLLARLKEIVEASHYSAENIKFGVTGHSLGGALAILAAFDIKELYPNTPMTVYTFGAPRVGSKGFAREYNQLIPDTWTVVNDEDPVPRIPKYVYKRTGQRVSIDEEGDIIVRPSYFELAVLTKSGGSVRHHWLRTYSLALGSIFKAQFIPGKALPGGAEGVRELLGSLDIGKALMLQNMDIASLQDGKVLPQRLSTFYHAESRKTGSKGPLLGRCWGECRELCSPESCESCFNAPPRSECSDEDDAEDYQEKVGSLEGSSEVEMNQGAGSGGEEADHVVVPTNQAAAVREV